MDIIQSLPFSYPVLLIRASDHITGLTGATLSIQLSKAGGAFAPVTPQVTEVGFGQYIVHYGADATDTAGAFSQHITATGADPFDAVDQVLPFTLALFPDTPDAGMLAMLKVALGIPLTDATKDVYLVKLLRYATTVVEGSTARYFGQPKLFIEYQHGLDERTMYLYGHIDENAPLAVVNPPAESLDVARRPCFLTGFTALEPLVENEDYERREDALLFLRWWSVWPRVDEFRLKYLDGYYEAPDDIQAVILEIAQDRYLTNLSSSSGMAGITGERLGDFSYTRDLRFATPGSGLMTTTSAATLNRYRRILIAPAGRCY